MVLYKKDIHVVLQTSSKKATMDASNTLLSILLLTFSYTSYAANSKLFREYIGAESDNVKLSDVPINPDVEFHFILAFAIDYRKGNHPSPTDGMFNVFWETNHLSPRDVASIKEKHRNVKFAVSLGGSTIGKEKVLFAPKSTNSWVQNAVSSLTKIIKEYSLDGIDIDYEQFKASPSIFADCIGQLITNLKKSKTISFASIAPYEDDQVQSHYLALWKSHGHAIDYVNFQFYAYDNIGISDFVSKFKQQASNYAGGQILASFISGGRGGLSPQHGFFEACNQLKRQGQLGGIFVWSADESLKSMFQNEKKSQALLAA